MLWNDIYNDFDECSLWAKFGIQQWYFAQSEHFLMLAIDVVPHRIRFNAFIFGPFLFSFSTSHLYSKLGISIPALGLEIFRQSILTIYHYYHEYGIFMYLDHLLILIQQSVLFYFVSNEKNVHSDKNGSRPLHIGYYIIPIICMIAILPKNTFDYLIVSNVVISIL